jgi:hypothetical protein
VPHRGDPGGREIDAAQVLRWRDGIGAGASQVSMYVFREMAAIYRTRLAAYGDTPRARRRFVQVGVLAIHAEGF